MFDVTSGKSGCYPVASSNAFRSRARNAEKPFSDPENGFYFCELVFVWLMVPEVGLEPTWALSPPDFESGAYTNFATPAEVSMIRRAFGEVKK